MIEFNLSNNERLVYVLNDLLKRALTASNQQFLHAELMEYSSYVKLASVTRRNSLDGLHHAGTFTKRIAILGGMPKFNEVFPLRIGRTVQEQVANDLEAKVDFIAGLNNAVQLYDEAGDGVSQELLKSIRAQQEQQLDWLEAELHQMREAGMDAYFSRQSEADDN